VPAARQRNGSQQQAETRDIRGYIEVSDLRELPRRSRSRSARSRFSRPVRSADRFRNYRSRLAKMILSLVLSIPSSVTLASNDRIRRKSREISGGKNQR